MPTKFSIQRDVNGIASYGLIQSDQTFGVVLASSAASYVACPEDEPYYMAIFSYTPGGSMYVAVKDSNAAPDIPTGTMGQINSELNPIARRVKRGEFVCLENNGASDCEATIAFYYCDTYVN